MSLENIDEKFKKVAKGFSEKNKKTNPTPQASSDALKEKDKYEDSFDKKPVVGLLSVFENHLRNQIKSNLENETDEEFRTVDLTTTETVTSDKIVEKVSEEEINSLLKITDKNSIKSNKKNSDLSITDEVYSQKRYDEQHEVQNKVAEASDLNILPEKMTQASIPPQRERYSDSKQTIDNSASAVDVSSGLQPVNKIVKETDEKVSQTKHVDQEVLNHIKAHRAKRDAERGNLPDNYQVESKN